MSPARSLAIVTDVDQRVGLHTARTLYRLGYRVRGLVRERAPRSRVLERVDAVDHDRLPAAIATILQTDPVALVVPVSIHAAFSLARAVRDGHPFPTVLASDFYALERANDKVRAIRAAERRSISVPRTIAIDGIDGLASALEDVPLPAVVKLRDDRGTYLAPSARYRILRNAADVRTASSAFPADLPLLVQEYVPGQGCGVGMLRGPDGMLHAAVAYRRVRECPPNGGPSSVAITVEEPGWIARSAALLDELGIVGAAHVEFRDTERGPVLMEVNPRLWGTVRLAEHAGQPIIDRWVAMAVHGAGAPSLGYEVGVRTRSLAHDLRGACIALRQGRPLHALAVARDLFVPGIRPLVHDRRDLREDLSLLGPKRRAPRLVVDPTAGGGPDRIARRVEAAIEAEIAEVMARKYGGKVGGKPSGRAAARPLRESPRTSPAPIPAPPPETVVEPQERTRSNPEETTQA